jgi:hypothetical protein
VDEDGGAVAHDFGDGVPEFVADAGGDAGDEDAGDGGVLALALAGGDDQVGLGLLDGLAARAAAESK